MNRPVLNTAARPPVYTGVTSRRHPFSYALYGVALLTGLFYMSHIFPADSVRFVASIADGYGWAWALVLMFFIGGVLGLIGISIPNQYTDTGWLIEGTGTTFAAFATGINTVINVAIEGWFVSGGYIITAVLALGYAVRGIQIIIEGRRLERVSLVMEAEHLARVLERPTPPKDE